MSGAFVITYLHHFVWHPWKLCFQHENTRVDSCFSCCGESSEEISSKSVQTEQLSQLLMKALKELRPEWFGLG